MGGALALSEPSVEEVRQRAHYDRLAINYQEHYGDRWSMAYRRRFIDAELCEGLDLDGLTILDGMCGPGQFSRYVATRWPGARLVGVDISERTVERYRQANPGASAVCASFLESGLPPESFDCVFVTGGLHHLHPHVERAIDEAHRLLKPGGVFAFCEPHSEGVLDVLRRLWYRMDPMFEKNEAAIDLRELQMKFLDRFEFLAERYRGNVAYFPVYNSMVLRVPHWLKSLMAPPLLWMEGVLMHGQGPRLSVYVVSQWRKRHKGSD